MVQHILQRSQTPWSNGEIILLIVSARFLRQTAPDNRETKADLPKITFSDDALAVADNKDEILYDGNA